MSAQVNSSPISASQEDYLLVILRLVRAGRVARSKEIADAAGVTPSSVTTALRHLAAGGFIHYDPYSYVTLTEAGLKLASDLERRYTLVREFLEHVLGIDAGPASANACRMEHAIDRDVRERLEQFLGFLNSQEGLLEEWKRYRQQ
ncbi:MAG: metal-dependent transcriptional regulator [Candidatus Hydrogenedentes bacterium]|nr:metal-dependent transcriptional regulator [Candidatus Hydrogenedentota bacterium]